MVDLTDKAAVSQIITEIESSENRDRRRYEWRGYEIYSGDQRKHVLNELKSRYPVEWGAMAVSNINILKKVVDKKAKVYKEPPLRRINGEENEDLGRIYENWNPSFQELDIIFNRHKCNLAWVQNDPLFPTEFRLIGLSPYTYDLIIDPDTFEVEAVILSYPGQTITHVDGEGLDKGKIKRADGTNQAIAESQQDSGEADAAYVMWSKEQHVQVNVSKLTDQRTGEIVTKIEYVIDPENPGMINPLGILPFVWTTTDPHVPEFPISSPLSFESVNINVLNSDVLTAMSYSMGQLLLKYPQGSKIKQVNRGHTLNIELPQSTNPEDPETTAEFINPNSDLNSMGEVVKEYAQAVIADEGIANFSLAGDATKFTSGFDRALSMADTTEVREANIEKYEKMEKMIFEIIKRFDQVNQTNMFSEDDELEVIYPRPKIFKTDEETLKIIEMKKNMGFIFDHEGLMMINPSLTEEQAREKIAEIREEKRQNMQQFMGEFGANNEEANNQDPRSEE